MPRARIEPSGPRSSAAGVGTSKQTKASAPKGSSGSHKGKMTHSFRKRGRK